MSRTPRRIVRTAVLATLGALLGASARLEAQVRPDTVARADSSRPLGEVRVRAAYAPRVVGSASAAVITPDSAPLGQTAPVMGEVLRQMPFLYVRQNSRGETELSVRGSESRQAAMLFEGVPLTLTWDARTDASAIPLAGVQRVEFVRGLSSLLAGPNAIGGVVTASLWPEHHAAERPATTTKVDLQGDQFGGLRASATVGGAVHHSATSTLSVRAGAGWRDQPGFARPGELDEIGTSDRLRLNTDARSVDLFAGARYEHAQGRYLSAFVSAFDGERGVAPELHITTPRLWRNPVVRRRIASVTAGTGALRSRLGVGDAELAVSYNQGNLEIESFADQRFATVTGTEQGDDRTVSVRAMFDQELGRFAVLRGAFTNADIRYLETIGSAPAQRYTQRLSSAALEVDVNPTRFVTLSAGLANDAATTTEAGGREPLGRTSGLGWRAGATWFMPMQGLRLHLSTSDRRRFPALRELYSGALGRFAPNPSLRPERARGAEAGLTIARAAFDGQVVAFTQRIDDAVVRITLPDRRFQRVNRDRFTSHGVELTVGTRLEKVALRGDITIQRARIADASITDETLRRPEDVPALFGSLLATAPVSDDVELLARLRAQGETQCSNPASGGLVGQPGAQAVDLGLERRWTPPGFLRRARLLFLLENVFDRAVFDKCGLPQAGRTARLGLSFG
jgi:iron complex outermembrane receptor protein